MHGLHHFTAAPTPIELRGNTFRLAPLTVGDYGALEHTVAGLCGRRVSKSGVTPSDVCAWLSDREGTAYALWLALLHFQPETTWAWCHELVAAASMTELTYVRKKLDDGCRLLPGKIAELNQSSDHDRERERPIPWPRIFRTLSLTYGWTPREIADLTLTQVCLYLDNTPQPGETVRLPASEARALARRNRADAVSRRAGLTKSKVRHEPFDALMTLTERLRTIGNDFPDNASCLHGLAAEQDGAAANEHDVPAHAGRWVPRAYNPMSFASGGNDAHASQQRQTEILLRVDENLRRLRELVESRAATAVALFADAL